MSLEIRSTRTLLGMRTIKPMLEVTPKEKVVLKQQKMEMQIQRQAPRVLIDQSQCFADLGFKNTPEISAEAAQLGRQRASDYAGQMAAEGDYLTKIEQGANVGDLAAQRVLNDAKSDWNIAFAPQSRPQVEVQGSLNLDWRVVEEMMEFKSFGRNFNFHPGRLEVYVQQYGKIEINYTIDQRI